MRPYSVLAASLALAAASINGAAHGQTLAIKGPGGRTAEITDAQLRDLHRLTVPAAYGDHHIYAGAPLSDLLALVGGPSDVTLHGPAVDQIVIVVGADKFYAVLSIAETARSFREAPVIIADEEDGKPLDAKEGPFRLIVGGELKAARSVRMVTTIELRPVAREAPPAP